MIIEASTFGVVQELAVQLAAFQAMLLLASGSHKLIQRGRTRDVLHEFAGVPRFLAPAAAPLLGCGEIVVGALLFAPQSRALGGALAALLWSAYLLFIGRGIVLGRRDVDCGCSFGSAHAPLGTYQVVRNLCLIGMAALLAAVSAASVAEPMALPQILAGFALLVLYGALDQVMALAPPRAGELR
jgi:Methylamine utilisation protein MauE